MAAVQAQKDDEGVGHEVSGPGRGGGVCTLEAGTVNTIAHKMNRNVH